MEQEIYTISKVSETIAYEFTSEGPKGEIIKRVNFRLMEEDPERIYNISFGDSDEDGNIDDVIVSNNADRQKVLQTVAATALVFFRKNPQAWIHAEGVTRSRTRLYQMGINRFWKEIDAEFIVIGLSCREWTFYKRGINYEAFLIRQK
jgi:hypothetical protein